MKFDEVTHKADIDTMNQDEALAFVTFLTVEGSRHLENLDECKDEVGRYLKLSDTTYHVASRRLWASEALRHQKDVKAISALLAKVKEKHGL